MRWISPRWRHLVQTAVPARELFLYLTKKQLTKVWPCLIPQQVVPLAHWEIKPPQPHPPHPPLDEIFLCGFTGDVVRVLGLGVEGRFGAVLGFGSLGLRVAVGLFPSVEVYGHDRQSQCGQENDHRYQTCEKMDVPLELGCDTSMIADNVCVSVCV